VLAVSFTLGLREFLGFGELPRKTDLLLLPLSRHESPLAASCVLPVAPLAEPTWQGKEGGKVNEPRIGSSAWRRFRP
jgi:hypothetical protein